MSPGSFFAELKRRNVYRVAVAYAVVAWLLIQVATQTFPFFEIPSWVVRAVILLLCLGFPVALILAWAFELTPEGIKRTEDVAPNESITRRTGRRLVSIIAILGLLALGLFLFQIVRTDRWAVRSKTVEDKDGRRSAASLPNQKSVAVLPFTDLSAAHDQGPSIWTSTLSSSIFSALIRVVKAQKAKLISLDVLSSSLPFRGAP